MAKAVDIIDGILFVRTRHYDNVKMVVVRHQEKPEKRFYKVNEGEWIKTNNGRTTDVYTCSICKRSILLCKNADLSKYPFCHCGAKMKGGGDHVKK